MFGIELGWWFGYSLRSFDVLGGTQPSEGLSDVHFIRLTLKDKSGKMCIRDRAIYALGMTTEEPERAKQLMGEACFIRGLLMRCV